MVVPQRRILILLVGALLLSACTAVDLSLSLGRSETLFRDEFVLGSTGDWDLEGDDSGRTMIVPEQLVIEVNTPNTLQYATLREPTFSDFVLEVDARLVTGNPESSYGVLFRIQSPEEFYRFVVTANGLYMLERRNADGSWERFLPDWRDSAAIRQGPNATNRLKVVADGPRLEVYANDTLLHEVRDDRYATGNIALDAGTFGATGLQVAFDNLLVYPPQ